MFGIIKIALIAAAAVSVIAAGAAAAKTVVPKATRTKKFGHKPVTPHDRLTCMVGFFCSSLSLVWAATVTNPVGLGIWAACMFGFSVYFLYTNLIDSFKLWLGFVSSEGLFANLGVLSIIFGL